jgi:hypothetical protein
MAGFCCAGYCQTESGEEISDPETDQQLESEIENDKAQGEEDLNEVDAEMDANSTSQTAVDQIMDSGE